MKTILFLVVLVIACVGAYLTRPTEAAMKEKADAVLRKNVSDKDTLGGAIKAGVEDVARTNKYDNWYLLTRYTASFKDKPLATCWGAYSQVMCSAAKAS